MSYASQANAGDGHGQTACHERRALPGRPTAASGAASVVRAANDGQWRRQACQANQPASTASGQQARQVASQKGKQSAGQKEALCVRPRRADGSASGQSQARCANKRPASKPSGRPVHVCVSGVSADAATCPRTISRSRPCEPLWWRLWLRVWRLGGLAAVDGFNSHRNQRVPSQVRSAGMRQWGR